MNEVSIREVKREEIPALAALAAEIWRQHFPPIVGAPMVEHMLKKFQSEPAMTRQVTEEGYHYYFLEWEGNPVGYVGVRPEEDSLFLSKFYLRKAYRGRKIGRKAIDFLVDYCREHHKKRIWLTVNRHNLNPIAAYKKMGFREIRTLKADVGDGFYMDDFVMEKQVEGENPSGSN